MFGVLTSSAGEAEVGRKTSSWSSGLGCERAANELTTIKAGKSEIWEGGGEAHVLFLQYLIGLEGKGGDDSFENGCHHVSSA